MRSTYLASLLVACSAILASTAVAEVRLESVSVTHQVSYGVNYPFQQQYPAGTQTFTASGHAPFSSVVNGTLGFSVTMPDANTTRFQATSIGITSGIPFGMMTGSVSGRAMFNVFGGTFTIDPAGGSIFGAGNMTIRNLDTNQSWSFSPHPFNPPAPTGDLPLPAGPGRYELTFGMSPLVANGMSNQASVLATLRFVPEPTSLLAIGVVALAGRRSRLLP